MKYNGFNEINELTAFLGEQMKKVASGELSHQDLSSLSQAAGKCMYEIKLKLDYCNARNETPDIESLGMKGMKQKFKKGENEKNDSTLRK